MCYAMYVDCAHLRNERTEKAPRSSFLDDQISNGHPTEPGTVKR